MLGQYKSIRLMLRCSWFFSLEFLLCHFALRRPGNGAIVQTVLHMRETADMRIFSLTLLSASFSMTLIPTVLRWRNARGPWIKGSLGLGFHRWTVMKTSWWHLNSLHCFVVLHLVKSGFVLPGKVGNVAVIYVFDCHC